MKNIKGNKMGDMIRSCDLRNPDFSPEKIVCEKCAPSCFISATKIIRKNYLLLILLCQLRVLAQFKNVKTTFR